ncbi:MAG: DUF4136 domain-containing protein [Bernardetiaceae bacterium]|jgi:hypothetical protein|nr:DUF4136 domain-containing protein [Bernardetiaceae bacterium]
MKPVIAFFFLAWLLSGCASVMVDFDRATNFSQYKTYAWVPPDLQTGHNPLYHSDLVNRNIKSQIEAELAKRGLVRNDRSPDCYIGFHIYVEKKTEQVSNPPAVYPGGYYRGWRYYPWGYSNWPYQWNTGFRTIRYDDGTLIIDLVDAASKNLIWRGSAESEVSTPGQISNQAIKGVEAIMRKFPVGGQVR